ncbi:hypothetical protein B0E53_02990 [Micromonospora sp. MH33]|uniref:hypothetical protein n=1 Tax=Micromonospora sp. MH33 TaxID=1945509 RepID=UPI000D14B6D2|nr:hypothetical protein [Micromonospora sp. MH33]PSK65034.1 hypothetical protein B0E53_02990 [Micromonospora sp. MH33]
MIDPPGAALLDRPWLRRRALPLAVALCWLVWAALAWWTAPRAVDEAELERDLAAGRVVTMARADGWQAGSTWGRRPEPRYAEGAWMVVWTRPDGQVRHASVPTRAPESGADPLADPRARDATTHGGDTLADALANAAGLLALTIGVGWLLMLVAGPPRVAGTRWFWFWIGLLPLGLGVLAWLHRERWRGDVPAARPRRSGWAGLGWLLLGGLLLSVAVAGLASLFGGYVVPGG